MSEPSSLVQRIGKPTREKRVGFFMLGDAMLISCALVLSFLVRFDFWLPEHYNAVLLNALPFFIFVKLVVFALFGVYRMTWRHAGIHDLFNLIKAMATAQLLLAVGVLVPMGDKLPALSFLHIPGFPRSVFLMEFFISGLFIVSLRLSKRLYLEAFRQNARTRGGKRTLIVGGGVSGEMIIRDLIRTASVYTPVAILDDNPERRGQYIHGVKVKGQVRDLPLLITTLHAEAVIIANQKLDYRTLRTIYEQAVKGGVATIKSVSPVADLGQPGVSLKNLEEISIEDLIGRQAVEVDREEIQAFISDRVVLITGAGGSIGSELVTQVCAFRPKALVLFDIDETELHTLQRRMDKNGVTGTFRIEYITGDVRDQLRVEEVFSRFRPEIVFHAAAYKHVPMMEMNPLEALKVNVLGTNILTRAAKEFHAHTFIMISTDKAVRPTSIMGASKRLAEEICRVENETCTTVFISVRFGNVLGSRGSVLPIFMEQLKKGGPLTVTHREMQRYFMTIPEAVSLVLQASVAGKGGEVMVLDMGDPVRIVSLAEELIRIHGLEPYRDIDIVFTGMRPGEKLFEEMLTAEEGVSANRRHKIFVANSGKGLDSTDMPHVLEECRRLLSERFTSSAEELYAVKTYLRKYIRHYQQDRS
ncbi:MAG TPA: nucleoside-diphosphate sugar epimerase/dehydratase [Dissulfurispiraceae bacterium]|nr:nucleoside-diphosphate sugar epimerase/dehydratase [Dissulfurispiraceae bacterium]